MVFRSFFFFLFISLFCRGQITFEKVYGGALVGSGNYWAFDMQQTSDSGFIITGNIYFNKTYAALLLKTNKKGDILWSQKYSLNGLSMTPTSIRITNDSGFIVTGSAVDTMLNPRQNTFLFKTTKTGNLTWGKVFHTAKDSFSMGSPYRTKAVRQTRSGGYLITGTIADPIIKTKSYFIQTDNLGNLLWSKSYHQLFPSALGDDFQVTPDSGFIMIGENYSSGTNTSIFLVKTNKKGNVSWSRNLGFLSSDSLLEFGGSTYHIELASNGGYAVSGPVQDVKNGSGIIHVFLFKTDNGGNVLWNRVYNILQTDETNGYSVKKTYDKGFALSGDSEDASDNDMIYLIKTDSTGIPAWNRTYGNPVDDGCEGYFAQQTSDSAFAILGSNYDYAATKTVSPIYLIKTNTLGNTYCQQFNLPVTFQTKMLNNNVITVKVDSMIFKDTSIVYSSSPSVLDTVIICESFFNSVASYSYNKNLIKVFPNPFSYKTTVELNFNERISIKIYDLFGKEVKEIEEGDHKTLTLYRDDLLSGVYLLQIRSTDRIIYSDKIIVLDN